MITAKTMNSMILIFLFESLNLILSKNAAIANRIMDNPN
jgi:hypothetical protein